MHLLVVLVCLALIMPSLSCAAGQSSASKGLELKLEKAPHLNEPVKLNCIRQTSQFFPPGQEKKISDNVSQEKGTPYVPAGQEENGKNKPKHEKITLEFVRVDPKSGRGIQVPVQEVLAGGSLNWEGNMTGEPMDFSATIKFPYEGNWRIRASSTQRSRDEDSIYLNITEDSSSFGWMPDYRPFTSPFPGKPTEQTPITIEVDITKPPLLDEPVKLTWALNSIRDIDEVISEINFYHMEGADKIKVPAIDMLIDGDLAWKGLLKKDSPLNFSATIKFSRQGDWLISAIADSYVEQQPINAGSGLYLHIDKDKSRWGWAEPHQKQREGLYEGPQPEPIIPGS
jgi:hypothetical protein